MRWCAGTEIARHDSSGTVRHDGASGGWRLCKARVRMPNRKWVSSLLAVASDGGSGGVSHQRQGEESIEGAPMAGGKTEASTVLFHT